MLWDGSHGTEYPGKWWGWVTAKSLSEREGQNWDFEAILDAQPVCLPHEATINTERQEPQPDSTSTFCKVSKQSLQSCLIPKSQDLCLYSDKVHKITTAHADTQEERLLLHKFCCLAPSFWKIYWVEVFSYLSGWSHFLSPQISLSWSYKKNTRSVGIIPIKVDFTCGKVDFKH